MLRNRFKPETKNAWLYHTDCLVCGMNQWDALHHIISPSLSVYVDGEHNRSILNSCPIHNNIHPHGEKSCHVGNEAWLHKNYGKLLTLTAKALGRLGYEFTPLDARFYQIYSKYYEE